MIQLKREYPYIDSNHIERTDLVKYYAIDTNINKYYKIKQVETNKLYDIAIDSYPTKYTYKTTIIEINSEEETRLE